MKYIPPLKEKTKNNNYDDNNNNKNKALPTRISFSPIE